MDSNFSAVSPSDKHITPETKEAVEKMIALLAVHRPADPVPFIYRYLKEVQRGKDPFKVDIFTQNETNEAQNYHKLEAHYKFLLRDRSYPESSDSESDLVDDIVPLKKNYKKQRQGLSTEIIPMYYPTEAGRPMIIGKSESTKAKLLQVMKKTLAFKHLSSEELQAMVSAFHEVQGIQGEVFVKEGQDFDGLCIMKSGMLDCSKSFRGNDYPTHLRTYSAGDSFGELCLYHNVKQAVALTGKTDFSVWKLDRAAY